MTDFQTAMADALYWRGVRHAYLQKFGKVDPEELARMIMTILGDFGIDVPEQVDWSTHSDGSDG